jgi:hypothetical protein
VPLNHALFEHEIGRHPCLSGRVLLADLLRDGGVVVRLFRPLRKRGGAFTQDGRRENGYPASAPAARGIGFDQGSDQSVQWCGLGWRSLVMLTH